MTRKHYLETINASQKWPCEYCVEYQTKFCNGTWEMCVLAQTYGKRDVVKNGAVPIFSD